MRLEHAVATLAGALVGFVLLFVRRIRATLRQLLVSTDLLCPTVDLSPFMRDEGVVIGEPPTTAQLAAAATIDRGCRVHGFMHVTNFGLSDDLQRRAFAASRELFALPEEVKHQTLSRISPKTNMGYAPFAYEQLNRARAADLKEAFNVRCPRVHNNDFTGAPAAFEPVALELWTVRAHSTGTASTRRVRVPCPCYSRYGGVAGDRAGVAAVRAGFGAGARP